MKQEPRSSQDLHERSRRWLMDDDTTGPETSTSPRAQVAAHNLHKQTDKTHRLRAISKPLPKTSAQAILEPAALTPEKVPVHRTVPASARAINRSPKKQLFIDNFGATKGTLSSEQTQKTASVTLINDLRSLARVETKGSSFTQTKPAAVVKCKKVSRWRFFSSRSALLTAAIVLFVSGMGVSAWGWRSGDQAQANLEQSSTSAAENIDEAPPSIDQPSEADVASYTVSSNLPRYLIIDSLGVKARVQTLGLTKSGAVQAPANVYDAGWYRGSSVPGSGSGAAFIDGHVSSWETDGVFKELSRLKAGDTVKVELGDGTMVTYKVVKTEISSVESVDMAAALAPVTPGKPGLNLMTCHGGVRSGTNEFAERFTVFTELI